MAAIEDGHHWRSLAIYGFFVAVVVAALTGYQIRTNHRLGQTDTDACVASRVLIINQRIVLRILERNTAELTATASSPRQAAYFRNSLRLIDGAQGRVDKIPACT